MTNLTLASRGSWHGGMEKRILVAVSGGKAKAFRTKWGLLRWAVTTREGRKYLFWRLFYRLIVPILRALRLTGHDPHEVVMTREEVRRWAKQMIEEEKQKWASPR
jgi:hypothetical protein